MESALPIGKLCDQGNSTSFLPFSAPCVGDDEIRELIAAIHSGWLTVGPRTKRFEEAFVDYLGGAETVATSSCTAALHLALRALGIGPGDAVVTSPFTFAATANVIVHCGAQVVFADICPQTYNLDPAAVARFFVEHCRPRADGGWVTRDSGRRVTALIAVHYAGQSCDMDELTELGRQYHFSVIEDAAHAAGARYHGKPVGILGRIACFSFYPTKNMTTGEGGMLATSDKALAARVRRLAHHGISQDGWQRYSASGSWRYDIEDAGYKYNMTDLQAALGLVQLKRLDGFIERRRHLASRYMQALEGRKDVTLPFHAANRHHSHHLFPIQIASSHVTRDQFIDELRRRDIGSSVHFIPLHLTGFYQKQFSFRRGDFPIAENVFERIVSLPLFPAMSEQQVDRVTAATCDILGGKQPS